MKTDPQGEESLVRVFEQKDRQPRQIAITGGTGFVGRQLAQWHLRMGDRVRVLSRRDVPGRDRVDSYRGDLLDEHFNPGAFLQGVDVLYHCAADLTNERVMQALHVDGTRRLAEAACGQVGRFVQLSSVGVYGACRSGEITESSPERPVGTYETTKALSDRIIVELGRDRGLDYAILRPSIIFGETMSNRSLHQMIAMIRRGWFFFVGPPGALVSYIHVDDVVQALALCAFHTQAAGRIYNLSETATLEAMVEAFAQGLGRKPPTLRLPEAPVRGLARLFGRVPGFPLTVSRIDALSNHCRYLPSRITQELGYQTSRPLPKAFQDFANTLAAGSPAGSRFD